MNIPEDVIYNVILPFLMCEKKHCYNHFDKNTKKEFLNLLTINKNTNFILSKFIPDCIQKDKLFFGKHIWCSVHNPMEYEIVLNIIDVISSNRIWPTNNTGNKLLSQEDYSNYTLSGTPMYAFHLYDYDIVLPENITILDLFLKLLDGTDYGVTHICCEGQGVMYGPISK